ncbi:TPA: diguanylate cyclase, partial [Klebsiella pneumoniae]
MKSEQSLLALVERLGLDSGELQERLALLEWQTEADGARLQAQAERMQPAHQAFAERLYQHLEGFSGPSRLLDDGATVARLKHSQLEYYQRLWRGPYDKDYLMGRLRIGLIHHLAGVEPKWYLAGYRLYLDQMLDTLFGEHPDAQTVRSLLKAVFFDISLAIDTYGAAQRRALEDSEARFSRALRGANDGLWDWHLEQDQLYVSERWAQMLDLDGHSLSGGSDSWFERVHPDDLAGLRRAIDQHLSGASGQLHHEYRIRRARGDYLWVLSRGVLALDLDGRRRLTGSQTDISSRKAAEEQLRHAARHDPLTGLGNRLLLNELLQQSLHQLARAGSRKAALLFIDLDRFKLINDSLGHQCGDQLLVEVARRLYLCLRPGDHLCRFGGDEFVVLLNDLACVEDA